MHKIADKLTQVKHRIQQVARLSGRNPDEITLLAVSKKHPAAAIADAYAAGQADFGENYLQEALDKMDTLADLAITWHFIGPIQSNKVKKIAQHFAWVHSVDNLKTAQKLSKHRPEDRAPLQYCIQVNIDNEASKAGVLPENLDELVKSVRNLPNITLRGLMAIPEKGTSKDDENNAFARLRQLLNELQIKRGKHFPELNTLSMGMSADMDDAVWEGATILRIGTDIFGPRP